MTSSSRSAPAAARIVFAMASAWGRSMPGCLELAGGGKGIEGVGAQTVCSWSLLSLPVGSSITSSSASKRYSHCQVLKPHFAAAGEACNPGWAHQSPIPAA